ncbi:MAG: prephenate dehydrogenase/arogenate dehydrogenase family protein [Desulfovibrio sp.]|jgi:prephenate dehydrogenase
MTLQTKDSAAPPSMVGIVGARGRMGTLLAGRAVAAGRGVVGLDRAPGSDLPAPEELPQLRQCGIVLLCVPVPALDPALEAVVPHLADNAVLADICSVKVLPMRRMRRAWSGSVVGTHPLFGPVIPEGFVPRVAVTPNSGTDPGPVNALLTDMGFEPFLSTPEEHDRAVAYMQGLNFISTVAHLAAMRQIRNIDKFLTPSFQRRLDSAHKMLTEDTDLFETISESNPHLQETVRQFTSFLNIAAGGDLDLLAEHARWWWRNKS